MQFNLTSDSMYGSLFGQVNMFKLQLYNEWTLEVLRILKAVGSAWIPPGPAMIVACCYLGLLIAGQTIITHQGVFHQELLCDFVSRFRLLL
jgi:hypothetical protein